MTAIQALTKELAKTVLRMNECITNAGYIKSECRYEYSDLVRRAREIRESIKYLEELYANKNS